MPQPAKTTASGSTAVRTQRRSFPSIQVAALALKSTHGTETVTGRVNYFKKELCHFCLSLLIWIRIQMCVFLLT